MTEQNCHRVERRELERFVSAALTKAGADQVSSDAVTKALVGASCRGVDSHGVRLLPHYVQVVQGGRINNAPNVMFKALSVSAGVVDVDNGFGHLGCYRAIEEGIELAKTTGMAGISIINSSHFGAAGAYSLAAAEAGYMAIVVSNSDKFVLAHDSVDSFHGTNPISFAAPIPGEQPYLIDMATSSIPWNRVLQFGAIGRELVPDVAVDDQGTMTSDPAQAAALLPIGGEQFGFKGAALGGLCDVLSAGLTGMGFSHQLASMGGPDFETPRKLGHFIIVLNPEVFIAPDFYKQHISAYLKDLRQQQAKAGTQVMAPGDREWKEQEDRLAIGIPMDSAMWADFEAVSENLGVSALVARTA